MRAALKFCPLEKKKKKKTTFKFCYGVQFFNDGRRHGGGWSQEDLLPEFLECCGRLAADRDVYLLQ